MAKRRLAPEPKTLPAPEVGESHDEFMERCIAGGNSEEECQVFWDEEQPEADDMQEEPGAEPEGDELPMPEEDEAEEDYLERCQAAGGTEEECQVIWDEAQDEPPAGDEMPTVPAETRTEAVRRKMPVHPRWLKATTDARPVGVDRKAGIIFGAVLAQAGPFKSQGRGEFDEQALAEIARLAGMKPRGLKARFAHPTLSDDGIGKHLGRHRDFYLSPVLVNRDGEEVSVPAVRADLHFDKTALQTPPAGGKPLGEYVMDLAESDPEALGCSLVLEVEELFRTDQKGRPLTDETGQQLPPLWLPKKLHAADVVDTGDATDCLLSAFKLPDAAVRQGTRLLDGVFAGQDRETTRARLLAYVDRYLELRYGPARQPRLARAKAQLQGLTAGGKRA